MFRGTVMTIICLVQVTLFALSTLALGLGSAGAFEICGVVFNLVAMFSVAAFYLHKILYFDGRLDKARNISVFAALTLLSFALFVLFLSRICSTRTDSLNSDFTTLGDQGVAESVVILVIFSFLLALIGLAAAFVSCYEEAEQSIPLKHSGTISNAQSVWYPFTTQNPPPNSPPPYILERVQY